MKKKIIAIFLVISIFLTVCAVNASASQNISVYLDGNPLYFDVSPTIIDSRTMVPMRSIFESLGASVDWEADSQTIRATKDGITIVMQIYNSSMWKDGQEIILDVAPILSDDRTLVPIRAVSESLDADVTWEAATGTVIITSKARKQLLLYRQTLEDDQKQIYDIIYINCKKGYAKFNIPGDYSGASFKTIFWSMFYDCPEFYYMEPDFTYWYNIYGTVESVEITYNGLDVYDNDFHSLSDPVIEEAQKLNTAEEKIKYIHDYLVSTVDYNLSSLYNQSAYSAIVYKDTVCAGYSRAFEYYMHALNIPCTYVSGYLEGENHAWNMVEINGKYYNVDVTNDDQGSTVSYRYFLVTDASIAKTHVRDDIGSRLPSCSSSDLENAA